MSLLSMLGLDRRLRQFRIAAGEGALAVEDRALLLRFAWEEERLRLRTIALLMVLVMGLTTVAVAIVSLAFVVHFWDTPHRVTVAWIMALVWVVIWAVATYMLVASMRKKSDSLEAAQREMASDWEWIRAQIGGEKPLKDRGTRRSVTPQELLRRIERQRERIAELRTPPPRDAAATDNETLSETATRLATGHPVAAAAVAAGIVAVVGPRRLLRTAAWLAPVIWRMHK